MSKKLYLISIILLFPLAMLSQSYTVQSLQKINNVEGGLSGSPLDASDRFGVGVEVIGDVDHDGIDDIAVGAWLDDDSVTDQGAIYILMLNADGTVKSQQKISATSGNGPTDFTTNQLYFGRSIAALGDLNGDGNVDIAVGMHAGGDNGVASGYGAVYILFLDSTGVVLEYQKISNNEGGGIGLLNANDNFGVRIDNIGDLNQDGLPDLAVGASGVDDGGANRGAIFILNLDYNGTAKSIQEISDTVGSFTGTLDDSDNFGGGVAGIGDIDGDGVIDLAIGAPLDDDGGTDRGAVWILFMNANGTVKSYQKISDTEGGFTGTLSNEDKFGQNIAALGDLDSDGIQELAVGALGDDDGATDAGAFWILYLDADGTVKSHNKISATDTILSAEIAAGDKFGIDIAYFGDRNNDGKLDLLVGAYQASDGTTTTGEVYVLHLEGAATYPNKTYHETVPFIIGINKHSAATGEPLETELGASDKYGFGTCAIGDLDGDGINDMAVGAFLDDDGGANRGAVYIQFLNADGSIKLYQKISDTQGGFTGTLADNCKFGSSLTNLGDLDGDGITDIAVGAYDDDDGGTTRGSVWILFLDTNGTVKSEQKISDTQGGFTGTLNNGDRFGISLSGINDIDGDGIQDLLVGARYDNSGGSNTGAVWVLFLDTNGTVKWHQKIAQGSGGLTVTFDLGDMFGTSITSIGDMDGDGVPDMAVGAYADDDVETNTGAVYIINLTDSGKVKSEQKISMASGNFNGFIEEADFFGASICGNYDFNQDGINDLLVGAIQNDNGGSNRGMYWMLMMNSDGTVNYHKTISSTSNLLTSLIDNDDFLGRSISIIDYNTQNNTAKIVISSAEDDDGATDAGAAYVLTIDLAALKDYSNNIFINTLSFSDSITYELEFRGDSASYTTKSIATMLIDNVDTTYTAKITVEATDSVGALTLLFDVNEVQITNVRVITDSLGSGDTLSLDSNLYKISNNGQMLTLYQRDTNEVDADSLLYGLVLQGGLGFSPDDDDNYDELAISGLENINQFELTIKDLSDNIVFTTTDKAEFWNGKYMGSGSLVAVGTYKYILEVNGNTLEGQILLDY